MRNPVLNPNRLRNTLKSGKSCHPFLHLVEACASRPARQFRWCDASREEFFPLLVQRFPKRLLPHSITSRVSIYVLPGIDTSTAGFQTSHIPGLLCRVPSTDARAWMNDTRPSFRMNVAHHHRGWNTRTNTIVSW